MRLQAEMGRGTYPSGDKEQYNIRVRVLFSHAHVEQLLVDFSADRLHAIPENVVVIVGAPQLVLADFYLAPCNLHDTAITFTTPVRKASSLEEREDRQ